MTEQQHRPLAEDRAALELRRLVSAGVEATLDGDAHLRIWEPNGGDGHWDLDLTDVLADLVAAGVGAPDAPEPHWADSGGTTLIVSLDLGSEGSIRLNGDPMSSRAATRLAANGFMALLRRIVDDRETTTEPIAESPERDETPR